MTKRILIVTVLLCLVFSAFTYAQSRQDGYIGMELGAFMPTGSNSIDFKMGYNLGAKFTHYFSENIGVVVGLNYISFDSEDYSNGAAKAHSEISTFALGGGLALRFPIMNALDLIADAGVTLNFNTFKASAGAGGFVASAEATDTNIGLFIDAGARYYFSDRIAAGALIRYTTNEWEGGVDLNGLSILVELGLMF